MPFARSRYDGIVRHAAYGIFWVMILACCRCTAFVARPSKLQSHSLAMSKGKTSFHQPNRKEFQWNPAQFASSLQRDIRRQRMARVIRDELVDIITTGDFDSLSSFDETQLLTVTVSGIELNGDLSTAKAVLSIGGTAVERRKIFVWLCKHIGQIRHSLRQRLRSMKRVPVVSFQLTDTSADDFLDQFFDDMTSSTGQPDVGEEGGLEDIDFEEVFA